MSGLESELQIKAGLGRAVQAIRLYHCEDSESWSNKVGITVSHLKLIEQGKNGLLSHQDIKNWSTLLGLASDEEGSLLVVARHMTSQEYWQSFQPFTPEVTRAIFEGAASGRQTVSLLSLLRKLRF